MMTNNADIWRITKLYEQVSPKSERMTLYPQANEHWLFCVHLRHKWIINFTEYVPDSCESHVGIPFFQDFLRKEAVMRRTGQTVKVRLCLPWQLSSPSFSVTLCLPLFLCTLESLSCCFNAEIPCWWFSLLVHFNLSFLCSTAEIKLQSSVCSVLSVCVCILWNTFSFRYPSFNKIQVVIAHMIQPIFFCFSP